MKPSETYQSKVEAQPDNVLFRFSLGQSLYEEGAVKESIPHLQKCVDARADWMVPCILLGKALLQTDKLEQAKAVLENALGLAVEQKHEEPEKELRAILEDL